MTLQGLDVSSGASHTEGRAGACVKHAVQHRCGIGWRLLETPECRKMCLRVLTTYAPEYKPTSLHLTLT